MATQQQSVKRCPLCGLREATSVSDESRRRDVSGDTWTITPLGKRLMAENARRQREAEYWERYHQCA
jgi:hypothetical protein